MLTTQPDPTANALALCLRLAAQRGREWRLKMTDAPAVEDRADDESHSGGAAPQPGDGEALAGGEA